MNCILNKTLIIMIVINISGTLCLSQTSSQLFQQALLKETGEGDLKSAVAIYEKIVKDDKADREFRAKAQLRIGMCWEKMGKAEAQNAYQFIINHFYDQTNIVLQAKERLALLQKNGKMPLYQPTYQKLFHIKHTIWDICSSPNEKWLVAGVVNQLWLYNLSTQERIILVDTLSQNYKSGLKWSHKGDYISFVTVSNDENCILWLYKIDQESGNLIGEPELYIFDLVIFEYDWHESQQKVAFTSMRPNNLVGIYSIDKKDIIWQQIKAQRMGPVQWALHQNSLFYSMWDTDDHHFNFSTYQFDMDTQIEEKRFPGSLLLIDINPEHNIIAMSYQEKGDNQTLLALHSLETEKTAYVKLLKNMYRIHHGHFSSEGSSILLPVMKEFSEITFIDLLDNKSVIQSIKGGFFCSPAFTHINNNYIYINYDMNSTMLHHINNTDKTEQIFPIDNVSTYPLCSPNGQYVLFSGRDTHKESWKIRLLELETGVLKTIEENSHMYGTWKRWAPNSQYVSYVTRQNEMNHTIVSDLKGHKKIIDKNKGFVLSAAWFNDSDAYIYTREGKECWSLIQSSLSQKKSIVLKYSDHPMYYPYLSHDNQYIAYIENDTLNQSQSLHVFSLGDQSDKILTTKMNENFQGKLTWLHDDSAIIDMIWREDNSTYISQFDISNGHEQILADSKRQSFLDFALSPDEKILAYEFYGSEKGATIWKIDITNAVKSIVNP